MNKLNESQVDCLIELVRQRPALFNTADKYHKNFAMKEMIWGEISESLRADKKDCKTAWKSLRDQFVKAAREEKIKTGQDITGRKTYKFYNKLLFLRESLHSNKMACKNETSMLEGGTMDFDVSTMFSVNPMLSPGPMPAPGQSRKRKSQQYSKDDDCIKEMLSEIISEIRKTNAGPPKGENDAFFMTLAGMVNKAQLTPNYTRHFQRRIFNFVADELDQIERNK